MAERESFVFYKDWMLTLEQLTDDERLVCYDAIMRYVFYGEEPKDRFIKIAIQQIILMIDRANGKWDDIRQKRSAAGRLGGAPKGNQNAKNENEKQAKTNKNKQNKQNKLNVNVNVNDNVNVNVNDNVISPIDKSIVDIDKEGCFDFSEYSAETMKGQQLMAALNVDERQFAILLEEVKIQWNILDKNEHQDRTDFDLHLRSTLLKWKDNGKLEKILAANCDVMLGAGEYVKDGRRTYGSGTVTVPNDAPPRPGGSFYWNQNRNQWEM